VRPVPPAPRRPRTQPPPRRPARGALLALAVVVPCLAAAAGDAPAPAAAPDAAPRPVEPAAIPLPDVIREAEDAYRFLRRLAGRLGEETPLPGLAARLEAVQAAADPALRAAAGIARPEARALLDLRQTLLRNEEELASVDARLEDQVRELDGSARELAAMDARWAATEAAAQREEAPAPVLARIAGLRGRVQELSARLRQGLGEALAVQDRVATLRLRLGDALAVVERAERLRAEQLFEVESVPLWTLAAHAGSPAVMGRHVAQAAAFHAQVLWSYGRSTAPELLALAALLAGLVVAAVLFGRRLHGLPAPDPVWDATARALGRPVAAAVLLALVAAALALPRAPVVVTQLLVLGTIVAYVRALGGLLDQRARRLVRGLGVAFLVDALSSLVPEHTLLSRTLLLALGVAGAWGAWWALRRNAWIAALPPRWGAATRAGLLTAIPLLVAAIACNAFGNVVLARVLTRGVLVSAAVAIAVVGVAQVASALLVGVLRAPRAQRFALVAQRGPFLAERGRALVQWAGLAGWAWATAVAFQIAVPLREAAAATLGLRLQVGGLDVSLADVLRFAAVLGVSVVLGRVIAFLTDVGLSGRGLPRGVANAISRTAQYVLVALGALAAVLASGVELTRFAVVAGALGVGIGFGLQNIVNNFVSGLILLYERPLAVGDVVEIGKTAGTVRRIGIRSCTLETFQNAEVVVPNAEILSGHLINWTLSNLLRRAEIDVGVAYGSSPEAVLEVLHGAARAHPDVLATPAPIALFTGFGDGALTFQLRFWTSGVDWGVVASQLRTAIVRALGERGIEIPVPRREVRVVPLPPGPAPALPGERAAPPAEDRPPGRGGPDGTGAR
jgi:small-conductance mechanosensitive channel